MKRPRGGSAALLVRNLHNCAVGHSYRLPLRSRNSGGCRSGKSARNRRQRSADFYRHRQRPTNFYRPGLRLRVVGEPGEQEWQSYERRQKQPHSGAVAGRSSSAFTDCRDSDLSRRQNRWWCRDGRPKIALAFQPLKGLLDLGFGLWDPNWRLICGSRGSPEFGANFWRQPPFELIVEEGNERTRVTSFDPDPHTELGICRIPALAGLIRPCTGEAEIPSRRNNETARHHFPGGRTDRRANGFLGPAVRARSRGSKPSQFCLSSGTDPPPRQ
jgi:hypothetical protein